WRLVDSPQPRAAETGGRAKRKHVGGDVNGLAIDGQAGIVGPTGFAGYRQLGVDRGVVPGAVGIAVVRYRDQNARSVAGVAVGGVRPLHGDDDKPAIVSVVN